MFTVALKWIWNGCEADAAVNLSCQFKSVRNTYGMENYQFYYHFQVWNVRMLLKTVVQTNVVDHEILVAKMFLVDQHVRY